MDMIYKSGFISETQQSEEEMMDIRKGPWTDEEDSMLKAYVHIHGEGRWNSVACLSENQNNLPVEVVALESRTEEEALVAVGMETVFMEDVFTSIEGVVETGDAATSGLNIGTDDEE
ncbi:hypothetical protein COLO4_37460 [Corchorus olitorius]|uniref:Uncharacterized protein n=1 Tax=Corchorus olitorius TaxID=93759 RepID=A0A1R3G1H6_9ROSI|nr:hypothetical protein COLO4_37460 [Corchorus olitorius]